MTQFGRRASKQRPGKYHNLNMKENPFEFLQIWYLSQCNGDWEHSYGIKIDTLDNPGWSVVIDLIDTNCENIEFHEVNIQKSESNWIQCEVKENKFFGYGGSQNLIDVIQIFISWLKHNC